MTGTAERSQDWDYDAVGNWNSVTTDGGSPQTRTHNLQNEITGVSGATTPTFDANGNMTQSETGLRYVYDAWNRLVAVKDAPGTTTLKTYAYDGLTRRISETASSVTTDLYYSSQWQVLEEQVEGDTTKRYVWSPVYVDAMILRDRATTTPGTLDERLWVIQDANFNVVGLVDANGDVVERFVYDPFGGVIILTPGYGNRGTSNYAWQHLHQGGRLDSVSGLYHFRNRDFSPTLGRWVSVDPLGYYANDVNLYRTESNAPSNHLDPTGLLTNGYLPLKRFYTDLLEAYEQDAIQRELDKTDNRRSFVDYLKKLGAEARKELVVILRFLADKTEAKLVVRLDQRIKKGDCSKCCRFDSKPKWEVSGGLFASENKYKTELTIPGVNAGKAFGIEISFDINYSIEENCKDNGTGGADVLVFTVSAKVKVKTGLLSDLTVPLDGRAKYVLECGQSEVEVGLRSVSKD